MAGKVELLTPSNGKVALVGQDTAVDVTVTVPAGTATLLNTASNIEAQVKTATNASGSAPIYSARAWVNFNGTTSPGTIRGSGNVSSVTKNGTGDYTVNFTTAFPDANYAMAGTASIDSRTEVNSLVGFSEATRLVGSIRINTRYVNSFATNGTNADFSTVAVAIFR